MMSALDVMIFSKSGTMQSTSLGRRQAWRFVLAAGLAVLLPSCRGPTPRPPDGSAARDRLLWPEPPERPRFAYEFALRSPADIAGDGELDQLRRALTGEQPSELPAFAKPAAVAAQHGRIYVTDTAARAIVVFDVPRRRVFRFGLREPGTLRTPVGLALDDSGRVYVADAGRREVVLFDSLGLFLRTIGGPTVLARPTGVAVSGDGERVYVVDRADNDSDRHRVVTFDAGGNRLLEIGRRGQLPGEFNAPLQAAVGLDGTLYVLDSGNFRVQAFDRDGRFLRSFGKVGTGLGDLARPRGLALDPEGNVYITDAAFANVQVFDPEGRLLLAIGEAGDADRPGRFALPIGIAVDETRRVYVVDQRFNKVEVYRRVGEAEADALARGTKQ
jgi:DNA-binding beta-propeller fold protein YncE